MSKVGVPDAGFAPQADNWNLAEKAKINSEFERSSLVAEAIVECIYNCLTSHDAPIENWKSYCKRLLAQSLEECRGI